MTRSYILSYMNESSHDITLSYTAPCVTWLIRIFCMTRSYILRNSLIYLAWLMVSYGSLHEMAHSYTAPCVTWLIRIFCMTFHMFRMRLLHIYYHDSFIYFAKSIHMSCEAPWLIHVFWMTPSYILQDAFISFMRLYDSFIYFAWLIRIFCRTYPYVL